MLDTSIEISVDLFFSLIKKAYAGLAGFTQERDFFKTATREYVKNLREDFGEVRVLGMKERMPLESLYVRANILEKIVARSGTTSEEMNEQRDQFLSAFGRTQKTVDGEGIVNREQKFIVLGKPGAGKTTYLKYLTLRMVSKDKNSHIEQRRLPIFITLHEFAKKDLTLLDFIAEQFDFCGFEEAQPFVERMLVNGDCIVLFDGLDEVGRETHLDDVVQEVTDFTRKYRDNQFVISCRVAAYHHWFDQFIDVEMADFNKGQIENFVENYFRKEEAVGAACWEKLQESKPLLEMASSPLLLTLLCITYDERQGFPPNRALLYGKAIETLIGKWDASRRIRRDKLYKELDETKLVLLLSRLAAGYFESDMYFFREEDLHRQIGNFLSDLIGPEALHKGPQVLQDIEEHYGILVRRSIFAYSFAHTTFLEYFTAQYVQDNAMSGSVNRLIDNHFREDRWLEVFLLTAGKLGSGTETFLLWMQRKNRELLRKSPELNELLRVTKSAVLPKTSKYPLVIREIISVFFIIDMNYYYDYHDYNRIKDIVRILTTDLASSRMRDRHMSYSIFRHRDHTRELDIVKLDVYIKTNSLNEQILKILLLYLKGNMWIVKCLDAGAFISQAIREQMLDGLFKPEN